MKNTEATINKHRIRRVVQVLAISLFLGCALTPAMALDTSLDMPGSYNQAIRAFELNPTFLNKYQALMKAFDKNPCKLNPVFMPGVFTDKKGKFLPFDQAARAYNDQPGVHDALKKIGLNAHSVLAGISTLMAAGVQAVAEQQPARVKAGLLVSAHLVSAENMAFYRKHQAEISELDKTLALSMLKADDGKPPKCLTNP